MAHYEMKRHGSSSAVRATDTDSGQDFYVIHREATELSDRFPERRYDVFHVTNDIPARNTFIGYATNGEWYWRQK